MRKQVSSISKYLLNIDTSEEAVEIYRRAIKEGNYRLTEKEFFIFQKIKHSVFLCGLYDTYSSIWDPDSNIRKRFFLILSILETQPNVSNKFLTPLTLQQSIRILFIGTIKYVVYLALGTLLVVTLNILFHVKRL